MTDWEVEKEILRGCLHEIERRQIKLELDTVLNLRRDTWRVLLWRGDPRGSGELRSVAGARVEKDLIHSDDVLEFSCMEWHVSRVPFVC